MKSMKESVDVVTDLVRKLEKDMKHFKHNLAEELRHLRAHRPTTTTSSSSSSSATPLTSSRWMARIFQLRGWSRFGSPPSKPTKSEATDVIRQINNLLSVDDESQIRWLAPYIQSHQMSAEVLDAAQSDPKSLRTASA